METSPVNRERGVPASPTAPPPSMLLPSPTSNNSSTTTSSSSGNNKSTANGHSHHYPNQYSPHRPPSTPTTPKQQQQQSHQTITRSDSNNPYPTTFVQADTSSFKQVVQMLTGSSDASKVASPPKHTTESDHLSHPHHHRHHHHHHQPPPKGSIPPIKTPSKSKPSKLYERRNSLKNFKINPLAPGFGSNSGFSPRNADILSPSMLDFPSLVLSPVTPLIADPFNRSPSAVQNGKPNDIVVDKAAEEKAIAEKGFYLHPSPASTPRESEPRLLPLFPVTSPRVSGSDSNFS